MGIGDWGLGIGDWGLGPIPNPHPHLGIKFIIHSIKSFIMLNQNNYIKLLKKWAMKI